MDIISLGRREDGEEVDPSALKNASTLYFWLVLSCMLFDQKCCLTINVYHVSSL